MFPNERHFKCMNTKLRSMHRCDNCVKQIALPKHKAAPWLVLATTTG